MSPMDFQGGQFPDHPGFQIASILEIFKRSDPGPYEIHDNLSHRFPFDFQHFNRMLSGLNK